MSVHELVHVVLCGNLVRLVRGISVAFIPDIKYVSGKEGIVNFLYQENDAFGCV